MVCRDLRTVPVVPLPDDLILRPVRRQSSDAPDGVPLREAAAIAMRADPTIRGDPDAFADYLRSLAPAFRLIAAVDTSGAVRATAGSGVFGIYASVIFVDTDPRWRGRGVGTAMTSTALHAARASGATTACLDASDAGLGIYRRLGFDAAGPVTRFYRPA
jgi:GNAT superfamily N-acetyltransferase